MKYDRRLQLFFLKQKITRVFTRNVDEDTLSDVLSYTRKRPIVDIDGLPSCDEPSPSGDAGTMTATQLLRLSCENQPH